MNFLGISRLLVKISSFDRFLLLCIHFSNHRTLQSPVLSTWTTNHIQLKWDSWKEASEPERSPLNWNHNVDTESTPPSSSTHSKFSEFGNTSEEFLWCEWKTTGFLKEDYVHLYRMNKSHENSLKFHFFFIIS